MTMSLNDWIDDTYPIKFYTTSVPIYKILLLKLWKLKKWIFALNLFVITIDFTILFFRERELVYVFNMCYLLLIEEKYV